MYANENARVVELAILAAYTKTQITNTARESCRKLNRMFAYILAGQMDVVQALESLKGLVWN